MYVSFVESRRPSANVDVPCAAQPDLGSPPRESFTDDLTVLPPPRRLGGASDCAVRGARTRARIGAFEYRKLIFNSPVPKTHRTSEDWTRSSLLLVP